MRGRSLASSFVFFAHPYVCHARARVFADAAQYPTTKRDKIIQMLDQGKNMNLEVYEDDEGSTPLMEAAATGNGPLVKMLLAKIFKDFNPKLAVKNFVNAKDALGCTALMEAKMGGSKECVKLLVQAGAV